MRHPPQPVESCEVEPADHIGSQHRCDTQPFVATGSSENRATAAPPADFRELAVPRQPHIEQRCRHPPAQVQRPPQEALPSRLILKAEKFLLQPELLRNRPLALLF